MKTKTVPAIVMLLGCSVASVVMYINGYEFGKMLRVLLLVLIIFLIMGLVIKKVIDKHIPLPEEEEISEDGEVIEKQSEDEDEDEEGLLDVDEDGSVVQASASEDNEE